MHPGRQDELTDLDGAAIREVRGEGVVLACHLNDLGLDDGQLVLSELGAGRLEDLGGVGAVPGQEAVGMPSGGIATEACGAQHTPAHAACGIEGGAETGEPTADDQDVIGGGWVVGHHLQPTGPESAAYTQKSLPCHQDRGWGQEQLRRSYR